MASIDYECDKHTLLYLHLFRSSSGYHASMNILLPMCNTDDYSTNSEMQSGSLGKTTNPHTRSCLSLVEENDMCYSIWSSNIYIIFYTICSI